MALVVVSSRSDEMYFSSKLVIHAQNILILVGMLECSCYYKDRKRRECRKNLNVLRKFLVQRLSGIRYIW
jgi:hypothetical protein